jgi:hypothetical protein
MFKKKVTCTNWTLALLAKIAPPYKLHVTRQELERRKFKKFLKPDFALLTSTAKLLSKMLV